MIQSLEINDNNLYSTGKVIDLGDGDFSLDRELLKYVPSVGDTYHTVKYFDRLDILSYRYYNFMHVDASKYWWVIADANFIENPLDLSSRVGKTIVIPNIIRALLDV